MAQRLTSPQQVGRAAQMAALEALLAESRSGARLAAISGEAGIGKSRLLAEAAASARNGGFAVHTGGCPPQVDGPPIPFAAVTQALRSILRSVDARALDRLLGATRTELARLLPEVGETVVDSPAATHDGSARLYEAILLLIERTAGPGGMMLVLEDMHWSDGPTRTLLSYLCRNLGAAPVLIAVSYRNEALPPHDPLPGLLQELVRVPGGELLHLEPLEPHDARTLLGYVAADGCTADQTAAIIRRSAGVPLYLEELARSTAGKGVASTPASLRASVGDRLAGLAPGARLLIEIVAVSGAPTDARLVARASGLRDDEARAALQEAVEHHLIVGVGGGTDLVDVRHDLVREAILAGMVPGEDRRLHGSLATAVSQRPSWGSGTELERTSWLARQLLAAGDEQQAVPVLVRAAAASRTALAFDDADRAYRRALAIVGDASPPFPASAWVDILTDAASAARLAGDPERAIAIQERAIALEDECPEPMAQAMARVHLGRYLAEAGRHGEALEVLGSIVVAAPAPSILLRAHMERVRILLAIRDSDTAAQEARVAVRMAGEVGAERDAARAYAALGVALSMSGRHTEALAALSQGRRVPHTGVGEEVTRPSRFPDSLLGYVDAATVMARAGDIEGATRTAQEGMAAARRLRLGGNWGQVLSATAARELLRQGRWQEAREALDASEPEGGGGPFGAVIRAILDVRQGNGDHAQRLLDGVTPADLSTSPACGWLPLRCTAIAELELSQARLAPARRAIADGLLAADADNDPLERAEVALLGVQIEADGAAEARDRKDLVSLDACERAGLAFLAQGQSDLAGQDIARLASDVGPWVVSLSARLRAESSRLDGRPDTAAWRDAAVAADRTPDRHAQATVRFRLAESLLYHGRERSEAAHVLRECREIAGSWVRTRCSRMRTGWRCGADSRSRSRSMYRPSTRSRSRAWPPWRWGSPTGRWMSWSYWRLAGRTGRSRSTCSSRRRPPVITCRTS